jgi:predicted CopG family antitoxin
MATKTISLKIEAYERLRRARRSPEESFSDVVLRATWPVETVNGQELLGLYRSRGSLLSEEEIERVEQLNKLDEAPVDKWAKG